MTTTRESKQVDEMPTACVHGESTDRRCDICFATQARLYSFTSYDSNKNVFSIFTPISESTNAVFARLVSREGTAPQIFELEASDYFPTFSLWYDQVQATMRLHGDDRNLGDFQSEQVNLAVLYVERTTPLATYRLLAVR